MRPPAVPGLLDELWELRGRLVQLAADAATADLEEERHGYARAAENVALAMVNLEIIPDRPPEGGESGESSTVA